jgi:GWxTD domain-containing protein
MSVSRGFIVSLILCCSLLSAAGTDISNSDEFTVWIENEVDPIISEEEKGFFLSLDSAKEKYRFINAFWKSLDPSPGTETNEFKNEHYKRLQVAVTRFSLNGVPGTDTIRGKVFVKLGEPVQILNYTNPPLVSYLEAWFYPPSRDCGIKYPFFVLFYIPEGEEQYDIYVPGVDDPYQLLATKYPGSRKKMNEYALKSLFRIDPVLGQLSLNLIPSEHRPIIYNNDTELRRALSRINPASKKLVRDLTGRPYMDAEERLSRIITYMEGKEEKARFSNNSYSRNFKHTSRVWRNKRGNPTYYVSTFIPSRDILFTESFGKGYCYFKVDIEAYNQSNNLVNSKTEYVSASYSTWELFNKSAPDLCYEGFLELPQGQYRVEVTLRNHSKGKAFRFGENIEIPAKRENTIRISQPALMLKHIRADFHHLKKTYNFGGRDIHPSPDSRFANGVDAEVYYQLFFPQRDRISGVTVRYSITYRNRVMWRGSEVLSKDQLVAGSFFSRGIKLPTSKLHPGKYKLRITAKTLSPPEARNTLDLNIVNRRSVLKTPILASVSK